MTISARVGKYTAEAESLNDVSMLRQLADVLEQEVKRKSAEADEARVEIEGAIENYVAKFGKLKIASIDEVTGEVVAEFTIENGCVPYVH